MEALLFHLERLRYEKIGLKIEATKKFKEIAKKISQLLGAQI